MKIIASDHEVVSPEIEAMIRKRISNAPFAVFLGMQIEEIRKDYARMRLPYRAEFNQPAGIVHGGAILSLMDTVVVLAIISGLDREPGRLSTVDIHTHFLEPVVEKDCIAEAVVRRRGKRLVFLHVEVRTPDGTLVADGSLCYKVTMPKDINTEPQKRSILNFEF